LSGTGGLRLGLEFARRFVPKSTKVYTPDPTWPNHMNIAKDAGFEWAHYKYYDPVKKGVAFDPLCADLERIPNG
jgi:aspartate/tyrosine/aromatic aminotransferase